jgi:hypothetical protein
MDWSSLEGEQVERMLAVIMRQRDYLARLIERMRIRKFPSDDPLYRAALAALEKASNLCVVLAKCRSSGDEEENVMGRKPWGGGG